MSTHCETDSSQKTPLKFLKLAEPSIGFLKYICEVCLEYTRFILQEPHYQLPFHACPLFYDLSPFQRVDKINHLVHQYFCGKNYSADPMDIMTIFSIVSHINELILSEIRSQKILEEGKELRRCSYPFCNCLVEGDHDNLELNHYKESNFKLDFNGSCDSEVLSEEMFKEGMRILEKKGNVSPKVEEWRRIGLLHRRCENESCPHNERISRMKNNHEFQVEVLSELFLQRGQAKSYGLKCHQNLVNEEYDIQQGVFVHRLRLLKILRHIGYEPDQELIYFKGKCVWRRIIFCRVLPYFFDLEYLSKDENRKARMNYALLFGRVRTESVEKLRQSYRNHFLKESVKRYEDEFPKFGGLEVFKKRSMSIYRLMISMSVFLLKGTLSEEAQKLILWGIHCECGKKGCCKENLKVYKECQQQLENLYRVKNRVFIENLSLRLSQAVYPNAPPFDTLDLDSLWCSTVRNKEFYAQYPGPLEYRKKFMTRNCSVCGAAEGFEVKKILRCGKCRYKYYCSQSCQKADWKKHKGECKKYRKRNRGIRKTLNDY